MEVNLKDKTIKTKYDKNISTEEIKEAIRRLGYKTEDYEY
ncbi:MAG: heavy metal-associated domain-containing protein [bacterium]|nr:heavy metal-associated domain-containing protein [bacterium]